MVVNDYEIKPGADLCGAYLRNANLRHANLRGVVLRYADLRYAYLCYAYLCYADLRHADLRDANLRDADLCGANLRGANLCGANLRGADLRDAKGSEETYVAPEKGSFEAWKKCRGGALVRLRVPAEAARSNATTRKCRAEFVEVLEVVGADVGVSSHDSRTTYRVGETVRCDKWDTDRWNECSGGIHFFMTRAEAEAW